MTSFSPTPKYEHKVIISIRISTKLLEEIEHGAATIGISRNSFIIQGIEYALSQLKIEKDLTKQQP